MSTQALRRAIPVGFSAAARGVRDFVVLAKPRIALSAALAAAAGMATQPGSWSAGAHWAALCGVMLCIASACVFNMWLERDSDARMARTRLRPLPAGKLDAGVAFAYATLLGAAGLALVAGFSGPMAAGLSLGALLLYAFAYTPLKKITPAASLVGIIPGAMPPIIGAAIPGVLTPAAWSLAALLALWQVPHLMAVALRLKQQYRGAALYTLLDWLGEEGAQRVMSAGLLLLVPAAFLPALAAPSWPQWVGCALSACIAAHAAFKSLKGPSELADSRWYIVMTGLYVLPIFLGALLANPLNP